MSKPMLSHVILICCAVLIAAFSQILLKKSTLKQHRKKIFEYMNIQVITAYGLLLLATFMNIVALTKVPVLVMPIAEATQYIYIAVFAKVFFREKITRTMMYGIGLIVAGVILYAL